jgi:uncharacterized membrane protein
MKSFSVINVNPGAIPAGALIPNLGLLSRRAKIFALGRSMARQKSGATLRCVFGHTGLGVAGSLVMLLVRFGLSALMVMAAVALYAMDMLWGAAGMIAAAVVVAMGFLTRIMMLGFAAVAGYWVVATGDYAGSMMIPYLLPAVVGLALLLALIGPGRLSCDSVMRRNIFRRVRRRQTRKLLEERFSYKAYHMARFHESV